MPIFSQSWVKRWISLRVGTSLRAATSIEKTPPALTDWSCASSPTSTTLAPASAAIAVMRSSVRVSARVASSRMTNWSVLNVVLLRACSWSHFAVLSHLMPRSSPRTLAATADGARPTTASRHRAGRPRPSSAFAWPSSSRAGGTDEQVDRRPEAATWAIAAAWSALRRPRSTARRTPSPTVTSGMAAAVESSARAKRSVLGCQHLSRGVDSRVPRPEDGRAIRSAEVDRTRCEFSRSQSDRVTFGGLDDHRHHRLALMRGTEPPAHGVLRRRRPQVPVPPGRPRGAHLVDHARAELDDQLQRDLVDVDNLRHAGRDDGPCPARRVLGDQRRCAFVPLPRQIGERANLLLRSSRERRLRAQLHDGRVRRAAAVPIDVLLDQAVLLLLDLASATGELADQLLA